MDTRRRQFFVATSLFISGILLLNYINDSPLSFGRLSSDEDRQKVLIILTQTRSGSSFTGEVFAATNNSVYFYEPLYPFGMDCPSYRSEKRGLLKQILSCNFTNIDDAYKNGFSVSGWQDGALCRKHGFCFTDASAGLQNSYRKTCEQLEPDVKDCGYPMRGDILRNVCENSSLIITKITRVCSVEELEDTYRHLKQLKKDTYVLHLVRDLRSIASSNIKIAGRSKLQGIKEGILSVFCSRQKQNVDYFDSVLRDKTKHSSIFEDGRYIRMRYEDFATNTIERANEVFRILKLPLPSEVAINIRERLQPNITLLKEIVRKDGEDARQAKGLLKGLNAFGTVRDPFKIVNEWRNIVPFEIVKSIQEKCGDVLKKLGYKLFKNEQDMKDISLPAYGH